MKVPHLKTDMLILLCELHVDIQRLSVQLIAVSSSLVGGDAKSTEVLVSCCKNDPSCKEVSLVYFVMSFQIYIKMAENKSNELCLQVERG